MIFILVYSGILVLMISFLFAPASIRDAMLWSVPKEARPQPPRYPFFAVAMIFLLGIALFREIGSDWPAKVTGHLGVFQKYSGLFVLVLLMALGVTACFWPFRFMRMFIEQLRNVPQSSIDPKPMKIVVAVARGFGVFFLLASSYVVVCLISLT